MDTKDTRTSCRTRKSYGGCSARRPNKNNRCYSLLAQFLLAKSTRQELKAQERPDKEAQVLGEIHDDANFQVFQVLPKDLLIKIFISLPAECLYRIQYVCKKWFNLINTSTFIKLHAQKSETVLLCRKLALAQPQSDDRPKWYVHFLDFDNASDVFVPSSIVDINIDIDIDILASSDGLVLAKMGKKVSLKLTNPMTRKHIELPLCTSTSATSHAEFYNLVFCNVEKRYKVVCLFFPKSSYIGCEILSVSTRTWKSTEGFSHELSCNVWQSPASLDGSLYLMPRKHSCNYYVAVNLHDEKFITKQLPTHCSVNDRLVEIGGLLGFITHAGHNIMQVWVLDQSKGTWINRYNIDKNFGLGYSLVPICSTRNGNKVLFAFPGGHLYAYNFNDGEMKLLYSVDDIETMHTSVERLYVPHQNTLVSWEFMASSTLPETSIS